MSKNLQGEVDYLQTYMKEVKKIKLLTHEETIELFKRYNDPNVNAKEKLKIRDKIAKSNLKFVVSVARKYRERKVDLMDLIAEGNFGLFRAIDRFDYTTDNRFITYAVWWIRQSILESLYKCERLITVPNNVVNDHHKYSREKDRLMDVDTFDIKEYEKLDHSALDVLPESVSIYTPTEVDGGVLLDMLSDETFPSPDESLDPNEGRRMLIEKMFTILNERERKILSGYFGLNGFETTFDDLGLELGFTKERIRQIKVGALRKLKNEAYHLINFF